MAIINFNSISGISTVTASYSVTVGDTFIKDKYVGLGTITTADRNAGVGTAIGTLIYNETSGEVQVYNGTFWDQLSNVSSGIVATGGIIGDYLDGSTYYRSHTFTSSGTFEVSALSTTLPNTVDYLIVAGGGAGQTYGGDAGYELGGGGAGAFIRQGVSSTKPVSVQSYPVVVGGGGAGGVFKSPATGLKGTPSTFYSLTADGGGGAGDGTDPSAPGSAGGSGGGGSYAPPASPGPGPTRFGGPATGAPAPAPVQSNGDVTDSPDAGWGHPGGDGTYNPNRGAGGGGGGSAGQPGPSGANGGAGLRTNIAGPNYPIGVPGPGGGNGWIVGGGGGIVDWASGATPPNGAGGGPGGPYAGGGNSGGPDTIGNPGTFATGGGGGSGRGGGTIKGGNGGSGIVVVRYQIGGVTATAKATGGAISYYGGKTIHTFLSSGTFATTSAIPSAECLVVAGGGGGGGQVGGGGGGGGVIYRPTMPFVNNDSVSIVIGAGGGGKAPAVPGGPGVNGIDSTLTLPGSHPFGALTYPQRAVVLVVDMIMVQHHQVVLVVVEEEEVHQVILVDLELNHLKLIQVLLNMEMEVVLEASIPGLEVEAEVLVVLDHHLLEKTVVVLAVLVLILVVFQHHMVKTDTLVAVEEDAPAAVLVELPEMVE